MYVIILVFTLSNFFFYRFSFFDSYLNGQRQKTGGGVAHCVLFSRTGEMAPQV